MRAGRRWTESELAAVQRHVAAGSYWDDALDDFPGRSGEAIRQKFRECQNGPQRPSPAIEHAPVATQELNEMARSAGVVQQPQAPQVRSAWIEDEDVAEIWERAEKSNEKRITKALTSDQFSVDFPADEPIAVAFISDQHISPGTPVDLARMRADAEYIRDTPNLFALLVGDGIDNHIKHRSAMLSMRSTASDQYRLFEYYLGIFAPKILALCSGNHDHWTKNFAGVDVLDYIAERQRICYSTHGFTIKVAVCGHEYTLCARHQYRYNSSMNQTHAPKQLWRFGEVDFDIGCVGHHHEPAMESGLMRGRERWYCRPGSYQITSDYSRQYGYNSTYPTCPTFVLSPRDRDITGFSDMRKGGHYLRSVMR